MKAAKNYVHYLRAERIDIMNNAEKMIIALSPEIEKKCMEINQKKREKRLERLFVLLAVAFLFIPTALIFFGVSIWTIFIPIIFIGAGFLILSSILTNENEGGLLYE